MSNLLSRFSIVQFSVITALLFTLALLAVSSQYLSAKWDEYALANQDKATVFLLDAFEKVAHHHAVERGLTAGYLGSPDPQKLNKLNAQREKADGAVADLRALLQENWPTSFKLQAHTHYLFSHIDNKASVRSQVNQHQGSAAFAYYSTLNRLALDAADSIKSNLSNHQIVEYLNTAFLLAHYKERAGQVRGKINGVLASKNIDAIKQRDIDGYANDIGVYSTYLDILLTGNDKRAFTALASDQNGKEIKRITQALLVQSPNFAALPSSDIWFPMATAQIGKVKSLLDAKWQAVYQASQESADGALTTFITVLVFVVLVLLVILALNIILLTSMKTRLSALTGNLDLVADKGDLTVILATQSDDELGRISRAVDKTFQAFRKLVQGFSHSVDNNTRLSSELEDVALRVVSEGESTQQMATSIATSVEQMALTSSEIAQSANQTLDASDTLNSYAEKSYEMNQLTSNSIEALSENMRVVQGRASMMEKQVTDIGGILETINNIAEQTNLLALNAAIEAARAGEQGRGFAVVADEVRSLAKGSQESSEKISRLLNELQSASNQVISAIDDNAQRSYEALNRTREAQTLSTELKEQASKVEALSTSVSTAAEEQSVASKQIAQDANQVMIAATKELDAATRMQGMVGEIEDTSKALRQRMASFIIE